MDEAVEKKSRTVLIYEMEVQHAPVQCGKQSIQVAMLIPLHGLNRCFEFLVVVLHTADQLFEMSLRRFEYSTSLL